MCGLSVESVATRAFALPVWALREDEPGNEAVGQSRPSLAPSRHLVKPGQIRPDLICSRDDGGRDCAVRDVATWQSLQDGVRHRRP